MATFSDEASDAAPDDQVLDLLILAEEWQEEGRRFTPEELCPDKPELWNVLEQRLRQLRQISRQMHLPKTCGVGQITVSIAPVARIQHPLPTIRGFELLNEIGRGGMGIVYRARQLSLDRIVAIKTFPGTLNATSRGRFRSETRTIAQLRHPNIVQIYHVAEDQEMPYFSMEFLEGGNLAQRLPGRPQPSVESARLVETLARAIHAAHAQGVIHRDLKPANILLDAEGAPKISDFGLAKRLEENANLTRSQILGTPSYMAPEQVRPGAANIGPGADVYALGVILYELLTGRVPHAGENSVETVIQVLELEPVPPSKLAPKVPRDLETICLHCLAKKPSQRYASALELADDLGRWLRHEPIRARPIGPGGRLWRWCQRHPSQAALGAAVVLVALLGLAGIVFQLARVERAREAAVVERDRAEWRTYRARIAAAVSALQLQNMEVARQNLESTLPQHRGWEWLHLDSQLDTSQTTLRGHTGPVTKLALSPDGTRIASGANDGTVRLWDSTGGQSLGILQVRDRLMGDLMFSPDGQRLVVSTASGPGAGGPAATIWLWDLAIGNPIAEIPTGERTHHCISVSPDGRFFSGVDSDGLKLWDGHTGELRCVLEKQTANMERAVFSPDSLTVAAGDNDGKLSIWETKSGHLLMQWQAHKSPITALSVSPDGKRFVTGAAYPDHTTHLWNAKTGELIDSLAGHSNLVSATVFNSDGTRIVTASWDQRAKLWDGVKGRLITKLVPIHSDRVLAAVFSPDDRFVATASEDETVRVWTVNGTLISVLRGHVGRVWDLVFTSDSRRIITCSHDGTLRMWNLELEQRNGILKGHTSYVYDVAFSPDGEQVASAGWDGSVRLWDATTGRQTALLQHDEPIVNSVAFSPDGTTLTSVAAGNKVYLWDLKTGSPKHTWKKSDTATYYGGRAVFDPTGTFIAAPGGNVPPHLFDVSSGREITLKGEGVNCIELAFSPDGSMLAAAGLGGKIQLWNMTSRSSIGILSGHENDVGGIAFSRDGKLIASASIDKTVRLWDAATHRELAVLRHGSEVNSVAFSPDGSRLASACRDNTIRLWDLATRDEVAKLRGHESYVRAIAFSPDGTRLVSASGDFNVRIWDTLSRQARARRSEHAHPDIDSTPSP